METFIASRLTNGNRVFRPKIIIDELGVTLKDPDYSAEKKKQYLTLVFFPSTLTVHL